MIKIGVCGFGTVGQSFVNHVLAYKEKIIKNCGRDVCISIIADRSIERKKFKTESIEFTSDILSVLDSDCDLVVELIGGTDLAYDLVKGAISKKKSVITANKALIAEKGEELFELSNKQNTYIGYEASVAGAIPVISSLKHNMLNENIISISGIINGTSNYILDQMSSAKKSFKDALKNAQELGYAEADPSFDIGGFDAAHKISILANIAFDIKSPYKNMHIEGIESIESMDIDYASELGYKIKHIATARSNDSQIECKVHPALVNKKNILSKIDGVMNAVKVIGDKFGTSMLYGHGAGGAATASAVVSNIIDYCIHLDRKVKSKPDPIGSGSRELVDIQNISNQYYLRMFANDVPGVMADITSTLAKHQISIEAVTQHEPFENEKLIPVVMITNSVRYKNILSAINKIETMDNIIGDINLIRVFNDD
jgi:homoserine dehydrogenase